MFRLNNLVIVCFYFYFCFIGTVFAHDFWIEPAEFQVTPGMELGISLKVGKAFSGELYRRNPPHIRDFYLFGENFKLAINGRPGSQPAGQVVIPASGNLVVGYRSYSNITELEADRFESYLHKEEFSQVIKSRQQSGTSDQPGREAFSRYAKAILQSGKMTDLGYKQVLGFELELIPQQNPYRLKKNRKLPILVLFNGMPLNNARIVAYNAEKSTQQIIAHTGMNGIASISLNDPGRWLIRSVHIVPVTDRPKVDWESFWASLTFEIASD